MHFNTSQIAQFSAVRFQYIEVEQEVNVLFIRLNRPEKRNAFTPTMVAEMAFALAYANENSDIWCVQIEANGSIFCAGMDMNVFQNPDLDTPNPTLPKPLKEPTLGGAFEALHKPSIALVKGGVWAGGMLIIGGCTFVLASKESIFALPEVQRGIFPMQVMASLSKHILYRKLMEMCLTAKTYTAEEAEKMGLISTICEDVEQEAKKIRESILQNSPFSIKKGMEAYHLMQSVEADDLYTFLKQKLTEIRDSEDAKEGIAAFREKRKAVWRNK